MTPRHRFEARAEARSAALRRESDPTQGVQARVSTQICSAAKPALALIGLLALAVLLGACARDPRFAAASEPLDRSGLSSAAGLVYVVSEPGSPHRTDLWRARLSDGAVQPLIQTPERDEDQPAWSDRASALVFKARRARPDAAVRRGLVLWRGGSESALPGERAGGELWGSWSPLGTSLAYVIRGFQPAGGEELIRSGVAVVDLEAGEQTILAGGERDERYARPVFAPDGRRVAAEYTTRRPRAARIVLFDGETAPQILTGDGYRASQPRFTRDGQFILFSRRPGLGREEPRDVMRMRPDGSQAQPVASTPESDDYLAAGSPARDEVAFLSDRDGKLDVFLVDLAGGRPRNLTAPLGLRVRKLRWSPDGEHLALTAFPHDPDLPQQDQPGATRGTAQVLVIDREGRVVLQTSGFAPDWMPPWG